MISAKVGTASINLNLKNQESESKFAITFQLDLRFYLFEVTR